MTPWEALRLDDACWKILKGLSQTPKTPQMLSRIYGIPVAETWKRVRFLEGLGLVTVLLTFFSNSGRVLYFYQTAGDNLNVVMEEVPTLYFQAAQ